MPAQLGSVPGSLCDLCASATLGWKKEGLSFQPQPTEPWLQALTWETRTLAAASAEGLALWGEAERWMWGGGEPAPDPEEQGGRSYSRTLSGLCLQRSHPYRAPLGAGGVQTCVASLCPAGTRGSSQFTDVKTEAWSLSNVFPSSDPASTQALGALCKSCHSASPLQLPINCSTPLAVSLCPRHSAQSASAQGLGTCCSSATWHQPASSPSPARPTPSALAPGPPGDPC